MIFAIISSVIFTPPPSRVAPQKDNQVSHLHENDLVQGVGCPSTLRDDDAGGGTVVLRLGPRLLEPWADLELASVVLALNGYPAAVREADAADVPPVGGARLDSAVDAIVDRCREAVSDRPLVA